MKLLLILSVLTIVSSTCPQVFTDNERGFAALYWSVLARANQAGCHECIVEKSRALGLHTSSDATTWTCYELLMAAVKGDKGCSDVCMNGGINQCTFLSDASLQQQDDAPIVSPSCQTCLNSTKGKEACSTLHGCQSYCTKDCILECGLPSECSAPSDATPPHPCQQCLSRYFGESTDEVWPKKQCLVSEKYKGCREYCVKNCGDGNIGTEEQCDDSNTINGDGCDSNCMIEYGYGCNSPSWDQRSTCKPICGDGIVMPGEECDDFNKKNGDGCNIDCKIEPYWQCSTPSGGGHSRCDGICGDLVLTGTEQCDDGNKVNKDGCSSNCDTEPGFICKGASCTAICGDGLVVQGEECDDHNTTDEDGCSSTCELEDGYRCVNESQEPSVCKAICGNGKVEKTEVCDYSVGTGTGCTSTCEQKEGFQCSYKGPETDSCENICGDGIIVDGEQCDDLNPKSNDGCSSTCEIERGYSCKSTAKNGQVSKCSTECTDGIVAGSEECDDGNSNDKDGCSNNCKVNDGWECELSTSGGPDSHCGVVCGDGIIISSLEDCDDKNTRNADGCSDTCKFEPGFICSKGAPSDCSPVCGDGIRAGKEECDDSNTANADGCDSECKVEVGYTCNDGKCTAICGDGLVTGEEECDDDNERSNDGCSSTCTVEDGYECSVVENKASVCVNTCGDGIVSTNEACDDSNQVAGDGCSPRCALEHGYSCATSPCTQVHIVCGDGIVAGDENCDDSNTIDGDGCNASCQTERGYNCASGSCTTVCGDGIVTGAETCDDGNAAGSDGCSETCTIEETGVPNVAWQCGEPGTSCWKQCTQLRVRKSWDALTAQEQATYRRSLELAMSSGFYAIFVGIHFESRNEQEAHSTCAFLAWHRKYLLAFENMLRSFGDEYLCVTIPYWDYFRDNARFTSGQCSSIEECSSITTGLGGSGGPFRTVNVPGSNPSSGSCSSGSPNQEACPISYHSSGVGSCSRCVPRGNWRNTRFPAGLGYSSLASLVSGGQGYASLTNGIQRGFHNTVHSSLGGIMGSLSSPADPIFFSHHNTIDMAYQIHHKCFFGRRLTEQEKRSDRNAFESCGGGPGSNSEVQMTVYSPELRRLVDPHEHPVTAPFFRGLPRQYWGYVDSTDIGPFSYNFEVDELLTALIRSGLVCRNPEYVFAQDHGIFTNRMTMEDNTYNPPAEYYVPPTHYVPPVYPSPPPAYYPQYDTASAFHSQRARQSYAPYEPKPYQPLSPYEQNYVQWFSDTCNKAKESLGYDSYYQVLQQTEYIECMNYERHYGCPDYTDVFKRNFHVNYKSKCRDVVDRINNGTLSITIDNWQKDCDQYMPYDSPVQYH